MKKWLNCLKTGKLPENGKNCLEMAQKAKNCLILQNGPKLTKWLKLPENGKNASKWQNDKIAKID